MWPYLPELLERPVPRYTSYPTAAEFEAVEVGFHDAGFDRLTPNTAVSLYVHIPFCDQICWYCGCNTGASNRTHRLAAYLDALHAEVDTVAERLGNQTQVTQLAFGGGSPNALDPVDFVRLLDHILIAFNAFDARLSIELDPRGLTSEWTALLGRAGVSHASLGVQTFDPELQARIGRIQTIESVRSAVGELRDARITSLNFDLMYGLPSQDVSHLEETLDQTIALRPDRIALFGYAHLPSIIKRQRQIDDRNMPDTQARFEMAVLGHQRLTQAGYTAIGFDHFALPEDPLAQAHHAGQMRRNFQGFTDDQSETLIGLGASAISSFPDRFVQNEKNSGRYRVRASANKLAGERGVMRSSADRKHGLVIEQLLCVGRAEIGEISLPPAIQTKFESLMEYGLVKTIGANMVITAEGRPYSRAIASLFDLHRNEQEDRFSNAV